MEHTQKEPLTLHTWLLCKSLSVGEEVPYTQKVILG
jgi:hypothetical protein